MPDDIEVVEEVSSHGRIEPVDLQTEMQRSYLDYSMSVIVSRALPDVRDGLKPVCEATVKLEVDGQSEYTAAEGSGVVNALDKALRKSLVPFFPEIQGVSLIDYKVRIVDGHAATAAKTRVLIVHTDGEHNWSTVGVSDSIIEASWIALTDGIDLFMQRRKG